jgi:pimeloyl-ACP methyl ester carboxylesterase
VKYMPYSYNDGVRLHYEVEGEGPPLVLQHGFTDSLLSWYELGYVDALKHDHQLILVDARGHGASDKPHDANAYTEELQVGDIIAVLQELNIRRANYFGYSMGGSIGFAMAQYAPERVKSLILGGTAGIGRTRRRERFLAVLKRDGAEGIPAMWGIPLPSGVQSRLVKNDIEALIACESVAIKPRDTLATMTMPCLVYAGDADPICPMLRETVAKMPNVVFFTLPGLGHAESGRRIDLVLPRVVEFLHNINSSRI